MRWVDYQGSREMVLSIVDLHALTVERDPGELRRRTLESGATLIAAGIDPEQVTLFVQSQVPEHSEMAWLMQCSCSFGELSRMVQFKEKREKAGFVSAALFTYPTLQAADILCHDTEEVPIGEDQKQHLELSRDIAKRFNSRYGETFVIPEPVIGTSAARVMDLSDPTAKMSKSLGGAGTILVTDSNDEIVKKVKRAVTDSEMSVRYDRQGKPGVSNLLEILAACENSDVESTGSDFENYGSLKAATAEAIVSLVEPIRASYEELMADEGELERLLQIGNAAARAKAQEVLTRAHSAIGMF